jgi:hypothetical protein
MFTMFTVTWFAASDSAGWIGLTEAEKELS